MSRPSKEIEDLARLAASRLPPRILADRKVPRSWKNRGIVDAVTLHAARARVDARPDLYPNRITRQQRRALRRAGPHSLR